MVVIGPVSLTTIYYMVVICPVSLDCTIYMLGVFAIEVSRLIGACICSLFKTRHDTHDMTNSIIQSPGVGAQLP